ncbi:hypothetical protein BDV12DRAFT_203691 [Aspergillus spectabilis]
MRTNQVFFQSTKELEGAWPTPVTKEEMLEVIKDWKCIDEISPVIGKMSKVNLSCVLFFVQAHRTHGFYRQVALALLGTLRIPSSLHSLKEPRRRSNWYD